MDRELRRVLESSPEGRAYLAAKKAAKSARSRRLAPRKAPGREAKEAKDARDAAFYERAKRGAAWRATSHGFVRCEVVDRGVRCGFAAVDPDHVLGGAYRNDSERLGDEGLMCLCRAHHDMKHANTPSRAFWLDQARDHAEGHDLPRLLALVEKARARYEAKHPSPTRTEVTR